MKSEQYFIYAIKSQKDGRIYVGISNNPPRRLYEHNLGNVFSTKGYRPWKLIYKEKAEGRVKARVREKYFKSGCGKAYLKTSAHSSVGRAVAF